MFYKYKKYWLWALKCDERCFIFILLFSNLSLSWINVSKKCLYKYKT